jgi:hypothetical protein
MFMASRRSAASRPFPTASVLLQNLEPRRLLANTVVVDDVDGELVTVKLTGPGEVRPILSGGASGYIDSLHLTGTTAASAVVLLRVSTYHAVTGQANHYAGRRQDKNCRTSDACARSTRAC